MHVNPMPTEHKNYSTTVEKCLRHSHISRPPKFPHHHVVLFADVSVEGTSQTLQLFSDLRRYFLQSQEHTMYEMSFSQTYLSTSM